MSLPRIEQTASEACGDRPDLPADLQELIPQARPNFGEVAGRRWRGFEEKFTLPALPILLVAISIVSVAGFFFLLGRATAPGSGGGQSVAAPPAPGSFVVLGGGGADVINCLSDTVTVFVADRSAPPGPVVTVLTVRSRSLPAVMESVSGGYRVSLHVSAGVVWTSADPPAPTLAAVPGHDITVRVAGLEHLHRVKVTGPSPPWGWMEQDTCWITAPIPR